MGLEVFSVIIPTLQRSGDLRAIVNQCAKHPLVLEILVINNASTPLFWESPKVRVLQQDENIFVNPAWNLGAREAQGKYLAIVNDDVRFDDEIFDYCAKILGRGLYGMIGIDGSIINQKSTAKITHRLATYEHVAIGFGTFMAMRRNAYVPVPDPMKIWGGDDWLFLSQSRPNAVLRNTKFETDMSITSGSPEFQRMRMEELRITNHHLGSIVGKKWWHRPTRIVGSLRRFRASLGK